jgi:thiol-disulfide isomerase/thioredoxin
MLILLFAAPWCGHCQRLAPVWEDLEESLLNDDSTNVVKVDCTQHKRTINHRLLVLAAGLFTAVSTAICTVYDVKGYPTLIFLRQDGAALAYKGSRKLVSLVACTDRQGWFHCSHCLLGA